MQNKLQVSHTHSHTLRTHQRLEFSYLSEFIVYIHISQVFAFKVCTLHKTVQTSYNLLAKHQDINTAHDFCPKTGNCATPTLWERLSQLISCGPGTSSSVTSTSETGPQAQALSLLLFQVQLSADTLRLHFFIFISASMAQRRPLVPPS